MHRLLKAGLMFGNLIRVDSPVLVERYNRALKHLTGRSTELTDFHVDISGFSPEIGQEFGDDLYLNQHGVNRQFILLTTEQKTAPLLNAQFSSTRSMLREFIDKNEAQLFALTARDAVAGEVVNSVFRIANAADLFQLRKLKVEADTTSGTVKTAAELGRLIDRFKGEEGGWCDDVLIAEMIGLAKTTGDITRNPLVLDMMSFERAHFWTAHFGGGYLFDLGGRETVIARDPAAFSDTKAKVYGLNEHSSIAKYLLKNELAESLVDARGIDVAAILQQKMDFIVADVASDLGEDLAGATRRDLRALARKYADRLPSEWHGLSQLRAWAEGAGSWPQITSEHPAFFYTLRATAHEASDVVNMLLAELSPKDFRQLFICHKQAFYEAYAKWPDAKRSYVVDFLVNEYQVDKVGTRTRLFGHEEPMREPEPRKKPKRDIVERVGPWGAIGRRR